MTHRLTSVYFPRLGILTQSHLSHYMTTKGEHITAESAHPQSTLPGSSQASVSANDESAGAKTKRAIDRGAEARYHCSCQPD